MDKLKEEQEKLADLEFELNITKMYYSDDEEKLNLAKAKYTRQLNKVLRLQKIGEKNEK